jgi:O-acetyl-ADP-ribose deacetylase (regulator of RNase III)
MSRICLLRGDITKLEEDAIVNAANNSLMGGGGVDGAIHRAAGPALLQECMGLGGCKTGEAKLTSAHNLPAKYIIHTVGPVYSPDKPAEMEKLLASCYNNSLKLAVDNNLKTIAFPNISTGVYGFPKERAARIAISCVKQFLCDESSIEEVTFVCFDEENHRIYQKLLA